MWGRGPLAFLLTGVGGPRLWRLWALGCLWQTVQEEDLAYGIWALGCLWQTVQEEDAQTVLRTAKPQTATEMALAQV